MRRRIPVIVAATCGILIATSAVAPSSLGEGGTLREWGGHRAREYRILGVPFSKTATAPGLKIMPDLTRALSSAGFRIPAEAFEQAEGENASRRTFKRTTCYILLYPFRGPAKDVVDFYAKQLRKTDIRRSLPGEESVEGIAPDGRTWISVSTQTGSPMALVQFIPHRL